MALRVGFAGTPAFAALALSRIADAGFSVPLVLTRPDKPKGRGQRVTEAPVKTEAIRRGLPVAQPAMLRDDRSTAQLRRLPLDVLVVAAYGLILPRAVLAWPRHGCLNIHASLLPRWRGAAPIERAIEAGDCSTGISIMRMDEGLDTGPVLATSEIAIDPRETGASLRDKLAECGARAIVDTLAALARDDRLPPAVPQPSEGATYARKVERDDARIDWPAPAHAIDRRIRAFEPEPGAFTFAGGERIKVRAAVPVVAHSAPPGTVVAATMQGIDVACGEGALRIVELQPAGGRTMSAAAYLAGRSLPPGVRLGDAANA
jgi:methionyl-tRNA formyltransferase